MANQLTRSQQQPSNSYLTLRDAMDRLLADSFVWPRSFFGAELSTAGFNRMPLDVYETPDEVVVKAAIPGARSEDLNLEFQGDRLIIDAKIPEEKIENATWHYRELQSGSYHAEVTLPEAVNADKAQANLENGYLTITLPKAEEVKPKKIQVKMNK